VRTGTPKTIFESILDLIDLTFPQFVDETAGDRLFFVGSELLDHVVLRASRAKQSQGE
jgi:hypothetical protein